MGTKSSRRRARIAILSHGTSEFDSRAQRIARTCAAAGDTVTIYSRSLAGLPAEEQLHGYRIVRLPLSEDDARQAAAGATGPTEVSRPTVPGSAGGTAGSTGGSASVIRSLRELARHLPTGAVVRHRFRQFPIRPKQRARWYADQVEPHDIWHGMWAGSLPALELVRGRHGGRTVYDARDVFLRSRMFDHMPRWQRSILSRYERRWARSADAVLQVSEAYAAMMQRDLGLGDIPIVRNCPDRWDPPSPRPDRIRQLLRLSSETAIVLYQGRVMGDRGIEQAMDAILTVPDAVLVIMGFGNQNGDQSSRDPYVAKSRQAPWLGKVHVIDPVPPVELLDWTASADIMVMAIQPRSENHRYMTPQKLWEALAAGVPVVAADLPGFAAVVRETGCGELCDPGSPDSIASAIRRILDGGPEAIRRLGDRGLAAAHDRYNWETQFAVLDEVYARLLEGRP
jgi:glycosyltransferase involved in cell wall biosynthesis